MSFGKMPIANSFLKKNQFNKQYFYNMEAGFCNTCFTFQLIKIPKARMMFNNNYAYLASTSSVMKKHWNKLSKKIIKKSKLNTRSFVVEIGSNDGIFLKNIAKKKINHLGVDASKNVCEIAKSKGINSLNDFFNIKTAKKIANMFNTNYYHTSFSDDLNGVEVSAAIKNIFSMAVGAAKGLCSKNISDEVREKNYLNTASALIKQSIFEMEIFVEHLKGKKETVKGLAGLGDLYVSSGGGRNAKMGAYIGEGLTFSEAKKTKMEKVTVEGADLAKEIAKKVNEDFNEKQLPLMLGMINAIVEDKKLELNWEAFR